MKGGTRGIDADGEPVIQAPHHDQRTGSTIVTRHRGRGARVDRIVIVIPSSREAGGEAFTHRPVVPEPRVSGRHPKARNGIAGQPRRPVDGGDVPLQVGERPRGEPVDPHQDSGRAPEEKVGGVKASGRESHRHASPSSPLGASTEGHQLIGHEIFEARWADNQTRMVGRTAPAHGGQSPNVAERTSATPSSSPVSSTTAWFRRPKK